MRQTTGLVFLLLLIPALPRAMGDDAEGFRPLFNGKDLSGWVLVNTPADTWTAKDNMLICSGAPIGEIRTERMYQNFVLELEWRHMKPKGNAGVFVWADDITARGVPFHRSVEVQVLENAYGNTRSHTTHGDIFPIHGATMTPINGRGGSRAFPTEERSKPSPEWNHYSIRCEDGAISLAVNGKIVTRGKDASPRKGYICLESEGGIVHYRNIRIKELPATPIDGGQIAIANRGFRSIYTGLDLAGWEGARDAIAKWQARDWVLAYNGEAASPTGSIATAESFGDVGFIFDIRYGKDFESIDIGLREDRAGFTIAPKAPRMKPHLERPGRWNRFEGEVRDHRLTVTLNGREIIRNKLLPEGISPIQISPNGPVDFANLYVRELK